MRGDCESCEDKIARVRSYRKEKERGVKKPGRYNNHRQQEEPDSGSLSSNSADRVGLNIQL
jgi:hypothetical protein